MQIKTGALQSFLCIEDSDVFGRKIMSHYEIISAMITELLAQYAHTC